MYEILVCGFFATFFASAIALTIVAQFLVFQRTKPAVEHNEWLARCVRNAFVPHWTFFAPDPVQENIYLVWRTRSPDGGQSDWSQSATLRRCGWRSWLWNPESRSQGALVLLLNDIRRQLRSQSYPVRFSLPYIAILGILSEEVVHRGAIEIQFAVLTEPLYDQRPSIQPLLVPEFHRV